MKQQPLSERLLDTLRDVHEALLTHLEERSDPVPGVRDGLAAVYQATMAALAGVDEEGLLLAPSASEWSMAEVIEHMVEHDGEYLEVERLGAVHYVEHGLEHALQIWSLRRDRPALEDPPPATLEQNVRTSESGGRRRGDGSIGGDAGG